jgi:hypothetical protein
MIAMLWIAATAVLSLFPRGSTPGFAAAVCLVLLVAIFAGYGSPGIRRQVKLTALWIPFAHWLQRGLTDWRPPSSLRSRRMRPRPAPGGR